MTHNSVNKVTFVPTTTVKEVIAILSSLPAEQQDWMFTCCGCSDFWLHQRGGEKAITLDTEEDFD